MEILIAVLAVALVLFFLTVWFTAAGWLAARRSEQHVAQVLTHFKKEN